MGKPTKFVHLSSCSIFGCLCLITVPKQFYLGSNEVADVHKQMEILHNLTLYREFKSIIRNEYSIKLSLLECFEQ